MTDEILDGQGADKALPSTSEVRWSTSDRGFRYYAEAEGHEVHESSAASAPHLWIDGEHLTLGEAAAVRDARPPGAFRDTLSVAIEQHYQIRQPARDSWEAGDPCDLCGSTDTTLIGDVAACNGCGASE